MKRNTIACIMLLSAMQIFASPSIIGRWQSAPMWRQFEKTEVEINFRDTVNFDIKVVADNTDFCDGTYTTMTMSGMYQLQDSLCVLTTTTYLEIPAPPPGKVGDLTDVEIFIIVPSNNSDDVIALVDKSSQEIFVFYRQK